MFFAGYCWISFAASTRKVHIKIPVGDAKYTSKLRTETRSIASLRCLQINFQYVKELIISYLQLFFRQYAGDNPQVLLCIVCVFVVYCLCFCCVFVVFFGACPQKMNYVFILTIFPTSFLPFILYPLFAKNPVFLFTVHSML